MSGVIYFDNAATTQISDEALKVYDMYSKELYFNVSSAYTPAVKIEKAVRDAKKSMMDILGAQKGEVIFTSGGTESDNLAIFGAAKRSRKKHAVTSSIEHPAVLNAFSELQEMGYEVTYLPVDEKGFVNPDDVADAVNAETFLVSIMHVNNETGAVQDIKSMVQKSKAKYKDILFHSDGVQAYGKIPVDLDSLGVDMYSLSAHKIHGPKGMGAIYVRDTKKIKPMLYGGGQQEGHRPGTINSPGIMSFAKAFEENRYSTKKDNALKEIKTYLSDAIISEIDDAMCINTGENYSNHILNVAFKGVNAETLLHTCQYAGLIISTGSACSSRKNIVSNTLKKMNIHDDYIGGAVRISFSGYNNLDEAKEAFKIIKKSVEGLRKFNRT